MKLALLLLMAGAAFAQEKEPTVAELKAEVARLREETQKCQVLYTFWRNASLQAQVNDLERKALEDAAKQKAIK